MTADALLPVGRDCDCGQPLVWRRGKQWCAVYGSHPTFVPIVNRRAPGALLIRDLVEATWPTRRKEYTA